MTKITPIHPKPDQANTMPYAPGIRVDNPGAFIYLSGSTSSPQYHQHPHVPEEHMHPDDIKEQTRRALHNIKQVLDAEGLTWKHVVKVTKFLTNMDEQDAMHEVLREYFGDWRPCSTLIGIKNLSSPGARIELDMIAVIPKRD